MDKELAFMLEPDEWPRWPVLPMKRYTKKDGVGYGVQMETGVLAERVMDTRYAWYPGANIHDPESLVDAIIIQSDDRNAIREAFKKLLEEGWVID